MTSSTEIAYLAPPAAAGCGCGGNCGCGGSCGCGSTCSGAGCALHGDGAVAGLERTRYYPRQLVTPDDLTQDQIYLADKLRRHNRLLHGWGIVCGLRVERCGTEGETGCRVTISPGFALDPYGNEVVVVAEQVVDLCQESFPGGPACLPPTDPWCHPVQAVRAPGTWYLALRHVEVPVKPVRAPDGCGCDDGGCEHSRIRDGYELTLLDRLPPHYDRDCGARRIQCAEASCCPPCPESGWLVLAAAELSGSTLIDLHPQAGRQYALSAAGRCFECHDVIETEPHFPGTPIRLVAAVSDRPDMVLTFRAVVAGRPADVALAVRREQLTGVTGVEAKELLDRAMVFDADDPAGVPFPAGELLAASPLRGASVIDGPEDLRARLGMPVVDPVADARLRDEVEGLLDEGGRRAFTRDRLGNLSRLDELPVDALASVAEAGRARLRAAGIETLGDLRAADSLPTLAGAADNRVRRMQTLLREGPAAAGVGGG